MIYAPLSDRQTLAMLWWSTKKYSDYDAIICDGSIRSGKTVAMSDGFIIWSMQTFQEQHFAICGKTVESLRRNIILQLRDWLPPEYLITEKRAENLLVITYGPKVNYFHIFGGRDESSYMLIQGMTLAGVLLDEVALMPRSFVEQAIARCSIPGSKYWFNCNPASPQHWFYLEWVLKSKQKRALRIHFTMSDNLGLTDEIRERYERQYSGVFYRRYILGEWCVAEGLVYSQFDPDIHVVKPDPDLHGSFYISVDYGTHNPFAAILWCIDDNGIATAISEYYWNGRERKREQTVEEYYKEIEKLAGNRKIEAVVIDPAAIEFITTVRRHGKFSVRPGLNAVNSGILCVQAALKGGFLRICSVCKSTIREFGLYSWDEKKTTDTVIKENDHAMDACRYFVYTILRRKSKRFKQYLYTAGVNDDDQTS